MKRFSKRAQLEENQDVIITIDQVRLQFSYKLVLTPRMETDIIVNISPESMTTAVMENTEPCARSIAVARVKFQSECPMFEEWISWPAEWSIESQWIVSERVTEAVFRDVGLYGLHILDKE